MRACAAAAATLGERARAETKGGGCRGGHGHEHELASIEVAGERHVAGDQVGFCLCFVEQVELVRQRHERVSGGCAVRWGGTASR